MSKRLAEIEARAEAATEGPWTADHEVHRHEPQGYIAITEKRGESICDTMNASYKLSEQLEESDEDGRWFSEQGLAKTMEFIAHSRTDIPALVRLVRALIEVHDSAMSFSSSRYKDALVALNAELARFEAGE